MANNVSKARPVVMRRKDYEALQAPAVMEKSKTQILGVVGDELLVQKHIITEMFHSYNPGMPDLAIDVRAIKDAIVAQTIEHHAYLATITDEWYAKILADGGVEESRINQLTGADIQRIIVAVRWPQGWTQIVDGNNRFVRRYRVGLRSVRFVLVSLIDCVKAGFVCEPGQENAMFAWRASNDPNVREIAFRTLDPTEAKRIIEEE